MNAPFAIAASIAAISAGAKPCLGGSSKSSKILGELTIADSSGESKGTLITSILNRAEFGSSPGRRSEQPANSSLERTPAEPET
ncbi:MAG: hypothetical protein BalsKO_05220 [Balneolaceae bacterium]